MIVSKESLKKKLLKAYENDETKKKCCICRKVIEEDDILNLRFEYCKSKINETWAHSKCANELINKKWKAVIELYVFQGICRNKK